MAPLSNLKIDQFLEIFQVIDEIGNMFQQNSNPNIKTLRLYFDCLGGSKKGCKCATIIAKISVDTPLFL